MEKLLKLLILLNLKNDLCEKFGLGLLDLVNKDFKWNLIFSVIRDIEENDFPKNLYCFLNL